MRDADVVTRYACPPDVAAADDDGRWVLLHLPSGQRLALSDTASRVWDGLVEGVDSADLAASLAQAYATDPDVVDRDVRALIDQLLAAGLLEPV
jgi:hypothetical protein